MKKKRSLKKSSNADIEGEIKTDIDLIEKEVNNEVRDVEKWVLARRKFLIKLIYALLFVTLLLLVLNFLS